jgi:exopolysaccharide biosynthesis polyprenyl glycosylphosphotransferase
VNIANVSIPRTATTLLVLDLVVLFTAAILVTIGPQYDDFKILQAKQVNFHFVTGLQYFTIILYCTCILSALFAMGLYQRAYIHGDRLLKNSIVVMVVTWVFAGWPIAQAGLLIKDISLLGFLFLHISLVAVLIMLRPIVYYYYSNFAKKTRIALIGSEAMQSDLSEVIYRVEPCESVVVLNEQIDCSQDTVSLKDTLFSLRSRKDIDQIVVDLPSPEFDMWCMRTEAGQSDTSHAKLLSKSMAIEQSARWLNIEEANSAMAKIHARPNSRIIKYLMETFLASLGLILVLPLMIIVAILIKLEDGGSIFYRQQRVGKDSHPFFLLKFRSMIENAEADGKARWARINDNRITRVGRIIRLTRMDELPQLVNIICGDMALVGPRPERPEFVSEINAQIPGYDVRHSVRPGLTGWAQINLAYTDSIEETVQKTQLDLYYIKNWSLCLDLAIIAQTVRIVIFAEGSR